MKITVRLKMTVLFAVLFTALAAVLVATAYSFVSARTSPQSEFAARETVFREVLTHAGVVLPETAQIPQLHPQGDSGGPGGPGGGVMVTDGNDQVTIAFRDIEKQARQGVLDDLVQTSILAFLIVALIAIPVAWWLAGKVLKPIDDVATEASTLSATSLSRRLPNDGPNDEFRRLKTAFNGMLDRLESAFESRQRFAADASHELRTPLAVLGAMADNVLDDAPSDRRTQTFAREVRAQVNRSESLVESLLTLARADDVGHSRERVDLADVTAAAVSAIADDAAKAGVSITLDLTDAPVLGDQILLGRLVENAVDNAIKYNAKRDGWVTVSTAVKGEVAILEVANVGPKVRADQIPRLFERFERGEARSEHDGHGLGMPIIRRVAQAHGGAVVAHPRRGGGLTLRVSIPLAPIAQASKNSKNPPA
jgi:signal transduction histidine kinase